LSFNGFMWETIWTVPFDRDLELAVIDQDGTHALVFPCRQARDGWINTQTEARVDVHPTHWRDWPPERKSLINDE
jgi:hypothetical protein